MKQKQTEAQREAKRLYRRFYNTQDAEYIHNDDMNRLAKDSAIICAKETEKAAVAVLELIAPLNAPKCSIFYRQVIRELKKM